MGLKAVAGNSNASSSTSLTVFGASVINALGDSITPCGGVYQPTNVPPSNCPQWQASTAYSVGNYVQNNGLPYYCIQAGTSASSGGPSGINSISSFVTDGSVHWYYAQPLANKNITQYLFWAEKLSEGRLVFDMAQGYSGLQYSIVKILVINGGSSYTAPVLTLNNGATGTLQLSNGVITGVTITNPGYAGTGPGSAFSYSVGDSTGSGAVLSIVSYPSGTFGVPNCQTSDMVARLPDVVACKADIIVVYGGTNDTYYLSENAAYAQATANLKICYETLIAAGKKVVAVPITPRTSLTTSKTAASERINNWIRAYCRKEAWANPNGYTSIALADPTRYLTDGTNISTIQPIGASGAGNGAMTSDGVHLSARGAYYVGYCVWQACQQFIGPAFVTAPRTASMIDGYDPTYNPGGNAIEGLPWQATTMYSAGALVSNGGNTYVCVSTGISASSGGPTGTGSTITDGSAAWTYERPQGCSVFASGTGGTQTASSGITYTGSLAAGYTIQRFTGSASGTVACSIENPWSDGQTGQRQVISWTLGSGGVIDYWELYITTLTAGSFGIQSGDLGNPNSLFFLEAELEISSVANLVQVFAILNDTGLNSFQAADGVYLLNRGAPTIHLTMPASSAEMLSYPNGGRLYFKTQPMMLPANLVSNALGAQLVFAFDASGSAGSATATAKINYLGLRRAFTA